jgi:hypothetical protein
MSTQKRVNKRALFDGDLETQNEVVQQLAKRSRDVTSGQSTSSIRVDDSIEEIKNRLIDLVILKASITNRLTKENAKNPKNQSIIDDLKIQLDAAVEEEFKLTKLLEKKRKIYTGAQDVLFNTDSENMQTLRLDIASLTQFRDTELRTVAPNQAIVAAFNAQINAKKLELNNSKTEVGSLAQMQIDIDNLEEQYDIEKAKVAPNANILSDLNEQLNAKIKQMKLARENIVLTPKEKHAHVDQTDIDYAYIEKLRKMIENMKNFQKMSLAALVNRNSSSASKSKTEKSKILAINDNEKRHQRRINKNLDDDNDDDNNNDDDDDNKLDINGDNSRTAFTGNEFEDPELTDEKMLNYAFW